MSVNRKDGVAMAKAFGEVAASYISSGSSPAEVAASMAVEAAAMVTRMTSPAGAAGMLRKVADTIERGGQIKAAPIPAASRPASAPEMMAIARTAVDAMAAEFGALANECAAMIKSGKSDAARKKLLSAASNFAKPRAGGQRK